MEENIQSNNHGNTFLAIKTEPFLKDLPITRNQNTKIE